MVPFAVRLKSSCALARATNANAANNKKYFFIIKKAFLFKEGHAYNYFFAG
jgi:hypothetical protein